jgi:hypothetical protein
MTTLGVLEKMNEINISLSKHMLLLDNIKFTLKKRNETLCSFAFQV